ncbi:hypothetical protein [Elizabethkingia sp. JS20170427COW]|uniref:hypothetical protein n=1 Tax=Elizabethkingia sp. JS20170427COW TaxID=2583851 RepID=UPI001110781E|nr:hypothetical protein [Elizabethkingia sp. JS20170427COW]QCX52924.1 hypothetical protein FGE20_03805 [Elizabethkingia sp. JS20170427COW]
MKSNKIYLNIITLLCIALLGIACEKKYEGKSSLESVKYNSNNSTYTAIELDSTKARNNILQIKLQELYDLSTNYAAGNKDTDIDETLYKQIGLYFEKPDTLLINNFIKELDSLKARYVKISDVSSSKEFTPKDTLDYTKYKVDYFDVSKKFLGSIDKFAHYTLKELPTSEQKVKGAFKFYFTDFKAPQKDSIPSGVTK